MGIVPSLNFVSSAPTPLTHSASKHLLEGSLREKNFALSARNDAGRPLHPNSVEGPIKPYPRRKRGNTTRFLDKDGNLQKQGKQADRRPHIADGLGVRILDQPGEASEQWTRGRRYA
ncbi:hypothetical protein [Reyranella sp.]|uniref:hypothetical protein n=1 Tax=Reyranella sp. TaxID=1929291 RepID=UPI0037842705